MELNNFFFGDTTYFFFIGTLYLIILTYQDHKNNNMVVDDRKNFFMMGLALSLLSHVNASLWYLFGLLGFTLGLGIIWKKLSGFGLGDVRAVQWCFYGLGVLSPVYLFWYMIILLSIGGLYLGLKHFVFKRKEPTPFFIVLLLSFVSTALLFGLYT